MTEIYVVLLEPGVWTSKWDGDPGRTTIRENAREYSTKLNAVAAIYDARRYRPFVDAKVMRAGWRK